MFLYECIVFAIGNLSNISNKIISILDNCNNFINKSHVIRCLDTNNFYDKNCNISNNNCECIQNNIIMIDSIFNIKIYLIFLYVSIIMIIYICCKKPKLINLNTIDTIEPITSITSITPITPIYTNYYIINDNNIDNTLPKYNEIDNLPPKYIK